MDLRELDVKRRRQMEERGGIFGKMDGVGNGKQRRRDGGACRQAATEREKWG